MSVTKTKTAGGKERRMPTAESASIVLTIGHSTRALDEFIRLLQAHGVSRVVDVRTVPRSRHNPQFNRDRFYKAVAEAAKQHNDSIQDTPEEHAFHDREGSVCNCLDQDGLAS